MPRSSALARLQQALVFALVAAAACWFVAFWPTRPGLAIAGALLLAFVHAPFLALEFIALRFVPVETPGLRPGWGEIVRAWWGETVQGLRVFGWRQPFRWREVPDFLPAASNTGKAGVVLVHGFVCNRGFWNPWLQRLRATGHPFVAVNLEPVFGSIDDYSPIIQDAVRRVSAASGRPPVIVCHSMGGLAVRAWLASEGRLPVQHVVTIGSPHQGTWLARFSRVPNGRQMRMAGEWLQALSARGSTQDVPFICWYSNCDNIVFPVTTATLPGADNRLVRGLAHVDLAFHRELVDATFESLDRAR